MNRLIGELITIITIVMSFVCCSSDELSTLKYDKELTIYAGVPATRLEYNQAAVSQLRWATGDSFQLYDNNSLGSTFSLIHGQSQIFAKFSGRDFPYATKAFYPASKASKSGFSEQSLSFVGETQTKNNSIQHLCDYTYLCCDISKNDQNTINDISFRHLTARIKFIITLPQKFAGTVTNLTLQSTDNHQLFYIEKYLDIYNASKNELTSKLQLNFSNIKIDKSHQLIAYMTIAPININNENLQLLVKTNNGTFYSASLENFSKNFIAGQQYSISASLKKSISPYSDTDYKLSKDGKTLVKWIGQEKVLDFSINSKLNQVTKIASKAFANNNYIETVILGKNIDTIEEHTFYFCPNLNEIILPDNLEYFKPAAVYGCPVSYKITNENAHFSVFENVLYDKNSTTLISYTNKQETFEIPNTVKIIEQKAFCAPFLKELTIPQTLEEIKDKGFIGCTSVNTVLLIKANPSDLKVNNNIFYSIPSNARYLVPIGSKIKYQMTSPWKNQMYNIEETDISSLSRLALVIDTPNFDADSNRYLITSDAQDIEINIKSNSKWAISTDVNWLTISQREGQNDAKIKIAIQRNGKYNRKGNILFAYNNQIVSLEIFQTARLATKIPIIMHIIYDEASDKNQNPSKERLYSILADLNVLFDESNYRSDMEIDFIAATKDPQGNPLKEAGINRYKVNDSNRSSKSMLDGKYTDFHHYFWEPTNYLNVFIFQFSDKYSGLANPPYMQSKYPMNGTNYTQVKLTIDNFEAPFGICMNNKYIYTESFAPSFAHELGHVLGLHHVFEEDYCDDTPLYNRNKYLNRIADYLNGDKSAEECDAYHRYDQYGHRFTSRNFMDYFVGYRDAWTNEQFKRMQYVIKHAQALPTSSAREYISTTTRSTTEKVYPKYVD